MVDKSYGWCEWCEVDGSWDFQICCVNYEEF